MLRKTSLFIIFIVLASFLKVSAQIKITGKVVDSDNKPLSKVTVALVGLAATTQTDSAGNYTIQSRLLNFSIRYKLTGYKIEVLKFSTSKDAELYRVVTLLPDVKDLKEVKVVDKRINLANASAININSLAVLPNASMNFESILKTLPGVSTNNELSSQYSVRGGNFDENLVYVNDVEINRPVLIRNGQQEGLSFVNADLVSKASFSAGGFGAKYGDKLSSVLDVKYEKPDSNQFVATAGLMGASVAAKANFNNSYLLFGYRRKDNRNILSTQDQQGEYTPVFNDVQALYNHNILPKLSVNTMLNFNTGRFQLIPESRETLFGTLNTPLRLKIDYEGKEADDYYNYGGAFTFNYHPESKTSIKWISSYFKMIERERFDIDGNYVFEEVDNTNTDGFGPIKKNRGLGSYYSYARNSLNSTNANTEVRVVHDFKKHLVTYGLKLDRSDYRDNLNEYNYIDSAGYVLAADVNSFTFENTIFAKNSLSINTFSAYLEDVFALNDKTKLYLGLRANYNDLSEELLFSPRVLLQVKPEQNKQLRFTAGIYRQPPSYRSIRNFDGELNFNQKAQASYNISSAFESNFFALGTPLKFTSEIYYKYAQKMIPYTVDNVRIKYLANELAKGHTIGADFSVSGEIVKDLLSNFRVSLLNTNQDVIGDSYTVPNGDGSMQTVTPGFLKRPTDQRLNVSLFFQDRLFKSPTYKVHLNLLYGSRLPIGSPNIKAYTDNFSIPSYRRVDIGFSNDFLDPQLINASGTLKRHFSAIILYAEVFNLLNINNTVSYLWLKDVNSVNYAIPNYLTSRQLNVKLVLRLRNK